MRDDEDGFASLWLKNMRYVYHILNGGRLLVVYDFLISAGYLLRFILYYLEYCLSRDPRIRGKYTAMYRYFRYSLQSFGSK
jgi:hypothetical protein